MTKKRSQSLAERLIKNSRNTAYQLDKSPVYSDKGIVTTGFPLLNVAWSGSVRGGYEEGKITTFAGPSKHGKTFLSFVSAKAFQDKYEDGIILFFDIEYGTPMDYLEGIGIDLDRMVHVPITNLEELKFDIVNQLNNLQEGDKVCIVLDSLSNTPSKKELEDTLSEKSTADMTRAREAKSLFRMITPLLAKHKVPMFVITHVYQTMDFISKAVVSGGCVVKDTKITMEDGTLKNIQDITVGERVKTLFGGKEVTHSWNPETLIEGTPECYELEFEDGTKVTCSDKHKFLVGDGDEFKWVEAKDLKEGMECARV